MFAELEKENKKLSSNGKLAAENERLRQLTTDIQQQLEEVLIASREEAVIASRREVEKALLVSRYEMEMEKRKDQKTIEHLNRLITHLNQVMLCVL